MATKVLVVGGRGFLGSHLSTELTKRGYEVEIAPHNVFTTEAKIVYCFANLPPEKIKILADICKDKKLIYFSSIAVLDEDMDEYKRRKIWAEKLLRGRAVIVRPPLVYDKSIMGMFHKIMGILRKQPTISIDNVVKEAISCMELPEGTYELYEGGH